MANSVITLDNVSFRYPDAGRDALSGVSLSIEAGSFIAVLGHNGSGKSTLAKLLNAILVPTEGTVTVKGMDTRSEENLLNVRRTVGMVFQNPDNQIVASVVEDDVAFAPENLGVSPAEIRRRVDEALKRVGMYEFRNNAPHLLSGGQKQRVAIAGVLAMQPEILVMDEPTAMLDPSGRREVLRTIADLRAATPSNAVELAVPDRQELQKKLQMMQASMQQSVQKSVKLGRQRLSALAEKRVLQSPLNYLEDRRVLLDFLSTRLQAAEQKTLHESKQRFVRLTAALDAMSPLKVLSRGYSMVTNEAGAVISRAADVRENETIRVSFSSGSLTARVEQIQEDAT